MRTPDIYTAQVVKKWDVQSLSDCHGWIPARPLSRPGLNLIWRLRLAWVVFTGKADVLGWQDEPPQ